MTNKKRISYIGKTILILSFLLFSKIIAQDYFPLEVGNTWTYCTDFDTTNIIIYHISDSINIGNMKYFLYRMNVPYPYDHIDTIRKDPVGNIWKKVKGIDHLWFDFTKDNGTIYTFPSFDSIYAYEVKLFKYFTVETYNRSYSQCIEFSFDIPQYRDADRSYSFAPDVGLIDIFGGEAPHYILYSVSLSESPLGIIDDGESKSILFGLKQNYPNPFNPITTIRYSIYKNSLVNIKIYDYLGREVSTLVNEEKKPGNYSIIFNAGGLSSGLYFCRMLTANFEETKKLLLIK